MDQAFQAQLCRTLEALVAPQDIQLSGYLVSRLDADGYLTGTVEDIAQRFRVPVARVAGVLGHLQAQPPIGIGARTVRGCLLLQLQVLETQDIHHPYAKAIVMEYLGWLAEERYGAIAAALGITRLQVTQAQTFIKGRLHPFPLVRHSSSVPPFLTRGSPGVEHA